MLSRLGSPPIWWVFDYIDRHPQFQLHMCKNRIEIRMSPRLAQHGHKMQKLSTLSDRHLNIAIHSVVIMGHLQSPHIF
ncbi:hypothetical protein PMI36_01708 [Pseudomonas sp. GM79]|nr:hypothetical protein PMI36_01708 [Pseudomonas sp. GM79]